MAERPSSEIATDGGSAGGSVTDVGRLKVVVAGMDLKREARDELAAVLGPGHVVRSIRDPGDVVDIVLVPPVSRQLTGMLRGMFPGAKILVSELADFALGVDFQGPVGQAIEAGADGYFVASSLDQMGTAVLDQLSAQPRAAIGSAGQRPTELGWSGATTTRIVHVISGDLDLQTEAARLSAVPLDPLAWHAQLFGQEGDASSLARCAELLWQTAMSIAAQGGAVITTSVIDWAPMATRSGVKIDFHS